LIPEHETITVSVLDRAKSLIFIQTGAGYDNVPIDECTQRGIYVANAPGINARAVAEHVFAFILCWHKNIIPLNAVMKAGDGTFNYTGSELCDKVIGIVGLGHIGKEVAQLALAFNMKVFGYHYRRVETVEKVEWMDLPNLLRLSDIVSLPMSLNRRTRQLIGEKELKLMKKDAFLINTSRGAVIDESALIEFLQKERIGGAALDVFEEEPLPANSPLRTLNNVIPTPHTAGEPDGLYFHSKRFKFFAENIRKIFEGRPPKGALNSL
jgi:D-3-phosphoglycerate dehydrogenase